MASIKSVDSHHCYDCETIYEFEEEYIQHMQKNHNYCLPCKRDFNSPEALQDHESTSSKHLKMFEKWQKRQSTIKKVDSEDTIQTDVVDELDLITSNEVLNDLPVKSVSGGETTMEICDRHITGPRHVSMKGHTDVDSFSEDNTKEAVSKEVKIESIKEVEHPVEQEITIQQVNIPTIVIEPPVSNEQKTVVVEETAQDNMSTAQEPTHVESEPVKEPTPASVEVDEESTVVQEMKVSIPKILLETPDQVVTELKPLSPMIGNETIVVIPEPVTSTTTNNPVAQATETVKTKRACCIIL
ncbi:hypothetical protein HDV02_004446 [Globomyces sp. JEL0801]|nr:hypothetical protein HDV02_004446 [Globomyces sp. JEL0801]